MRTLRTKGFGRKRPNSSPVHSGGTPTGGGGFAYQRTITIDNSAGTAKTDYPVAVSLTSANFNFTHTQSDGRDIQFKSGATVLSHWVESWDAAGQTATIWVKLPSIGASASPTITMLYGDAAATSTSNIHNTFIFGEDFNSLDTLIGYPDKTYPVRTGAYDIVFGNGRLMASAGAAGTWNELIHEQANVIYDPLDADPNKRFKFYYTGQTAPANTGDRHIGLSCSPDLQTWTEYAGNPVIGNGTDPNRGEDPYVVRNIDGSAYRDPGGLLHMFTEDQGQQDTLHYTSSDGITWTADPANPVIARGTTGSFDDAIVASPIVMHLGGDNSFYMVYEARSSVADASDTSGNQTECSAAATATTLMGKSWTKKGKIHYGDVPDDLVWDADNSTWIYTYHHTAGFLARAYTTKADPLTWTLGDFVDYSPSNGLFPTDGSSHNFSPSKADGSGFGKSITVHDPTNSGLYLYDVIGSSSWLFERIGANKNPRLAIIRPNYGGNGTLILDPTNDNTSSTAHYFAYTRQLALTTDFQVMMRRKTDLTTDDGWVQVGVGSGVPNIASGFAYTDGGGYFFNVGNPPSASIRKYVSGNSTGTTLTTGSVTTTEAYAFNKYALSYLSAGTIRVDFNGASRMSASDTANAATSKNVIISQGSTSGVPQGGKQTVDWVVVRKYDGQDPATSVGAEA